MGLDKKPTPPQKRVKEELPTSKSPDAKEATDVEEDIDAHSNAVPDTPQEMETERNGETRGKKKTKDDYEEDFEADDEGPVEDGDEVEEKTSSGANGGEKDTRDENEINKVKSDSESDDASMSKVKRSSSVSSGRTSSLSSSDNDSEREIVEEAKEVTTANVPEESLDAGEDLNTAETKPEETEVTESSDITLPQAAAEDSGTQDSPGDGMKKSDLEMSEDTDKKEGTEGEQSGDDAKPEDKPQENEPERAKSMQEKLAEAIESQCSSEPEFSDTSTEEDEGASVKTQQDGQEAETESVVGFTSPQPSNTQDEIAEKSEANKRESVCEETTQEPHVQTEEERGQTPEAADSLDIEEKQKDEQSEKTNEVEQQDTREEVKTETEGMQEKDKNGDTNAEVNTESKEEEKDTLVQEPETHTEMLDTGNTDTEVPEMDSVPHTENDTETGAGDTQRQRDADDADQNIERRSDGQPDRDEREDLADEAGDDRSTGEMVQKTDGKVDGGGSVGKEEDCEKSSEEKELEVEDTSEDLGIEEAEKPGDEEIQVGEKENELEGDQDSKAEDRQNKDSTEKDKDGVNDEHKESEDGELSTEVRLNESQESQNVKAEGNEKEDDGVNDEQKETEDGEQVKNILSGEAEDEGPDKNMDDMIQEEEKEEDGKMDEMAEGTDTNYVENKLETGENLIEEPEKEVADINEISENTLESGDGKEAVSGENIAQKLEDNFEDQNEESVSQEELNEMGSSGGPKDDTEANTKDELGEPAEMNNDLLDNKIDAENGERQDVSLEEAEKVEEYLQEETQDKSGGETTGDSAQEVIDDNEQPETDKDMKEENGNDKEQEIEDKLNDQVVPSESESQLGSQHEDQGSDNQKAEKEDDKESETSATTFIENITPQTPQPMADKDTESEIVSTEAEVIAEEQELTGTDNELRSRDPPEGMECDSVQPLEKKGNLANVEDSSSFSHSVESQPVTKVKKGDQDPVLSIDSDDLEVHPAALTKVVGVDLVSNWINIHQESKYFETFIEPLNEEGLITEETEERVNSEVLDATDTPPSTDIGGLDETLKSTDETATPIRSNINENTESVEDLKTETKVEAIEADAYSSHSKDSTHTLNKDERVQEAGDTRGSLVTSWSRLGNNEDTNQNDTPRKETLTSDDVINLGATSEDIQDRVPSETEQQNVPRNYDLDAKEQSNQQNMTDETKHLVQPEEASNQETLESLEDNDVINIGTTATSEEIQDRVPSETEQQNVNRNVDLDAKESEQSNQQNMTDETKHLAQTQDASNQETLEDNLKPEHVPQSEYIEPQSSTITLITDLTIVNKSENGSQDDTASVDFDFRQSDGSRNVNGNRTKVIDGHFKQTLSTETLSTFSLDDSRFFGPAGYPRLTTAHTENSY